MSEPARCAVALLASLVAAGAFAAAVACRSDDRDRAAGERAAPAPPAARERQAAPLAPGRPAAPSMAANRSAAPPPAAPPLTAEEQATIEKVMAARDEIAAIAEARADSCDKAAREIAAVVERSRAILAASSAMERDPAKHRWIGETYGARTLASSTKLMALMERCDPHEGLSRIFQSLE